MCDVVWHCQQIGGAAKGGVAEERHIMEMGKAIEHAQGREGSVGARKYGYAGVDTDPGRTLASHAWVLVSATLADPGDLGTRGLSRIDKREPGLLSRECFRMDLKTSRGRSKGQESAWG